MDEGDGTPDKLENESLKSGKAVIRSFVTFNNSSNRQIDIYWVNYAGNHIHYSSLINNGDSVKVNTYETHPWITNCRRTGERLHLAGGPVLFPKAWYKCLQGGPEMSIKRQEVEVHYPLKTLKSICEWEIVRMVQKKESINVLELPRILENDLLQVYKESESYRTSNLL